MNNLEEKVIEVENGNYYVLKQIIHNETVYLLANKLIDDDTPSDEISVLKLVLENEKIIVKYEEDDSIRNDVLNIFQKKYEE